MRKATTSAEDRINALDDADEMAVSKLPFATIRQQRGFW